MDWKYYMIPSEVPKILNKAKKFLNERDYYRFEFLLDLVEETDGYTKAFLQTKIINYTREIIRKSKVKN